jgi:thiol-disulfide isomerase/thioredoxin
MKIKIIACLLLMTLLLQYAFAQRVKAPKQLFTLKGKLNSVHMDSVILYYKDTVGQEVFQCRPIYNDVFIISDDIIRPVPARMFFKNTDEVLTDSQIAARQMNIFLEPGLLLLTGNPNRMASIKITGSQSQDELDTLNNSIAPVIAEMRPLAIAYQKETDPEKAAIIRTKFEPYEDRIKSISYHFFTNHPNSYVTANQMLYYVNQVSLDSSRRIYKIYSDELKQTAEGKSLAAEIKKMESVLPGKMAPDFTTTDVNGRTITLSNYKGNYVLLDFWASWCPSCRKGNPHMAELYKKYQNKCFEMIGIADDDGTQEAWKKAIARDSLIAWSNVLSGGESDDNISEKYAIHFVPTRILIDPTGKIIGRFGDNNNSDVNMDRMLWDIFRKIPDPIPKDSGVLPPLLAGGKGTD